MFDSREVSQVAFDRLADKRGFGHVGEFGNFSDLRHDGGIGFE